MRRAVWTYLRQQGQQGLFRAHSSPLPSSPLLSPPPPPPFPCTPVRLGLIAQHLQLLGPPRSCPRHTLCPLYLSPLLPPFLPFPPSPAYLFASASSPSTSSCSSSALQRRTSTCGTHAGRGVVEEQDLKGREEQDGKKTHTQRGRAPITEPAGREAMEGLLMRSPGKGASSGGGVFRVSGF